MLIKMVDGGLVDIEQDSEVYLGSCPTCDYGKYAANYYKFTFTNIEVTVEIKRDYSDSLVLNESDMMKIILPNVNKIEDMEECQFEEFIKEEIDNYISDSNVYIDINKYIL